MASIKSTKRTAKGVILEVLADYEEFLNLEGNLDSVNIFAEKKEAVQTHISQRGKNGATKYFLIPRKMRKGFEFDNSISCFRIDKKNHVLFIYVVDKLSFNNKKRFIEGETLS